MFVQECIELNYITILDIVLQSGMMQKLHPYNFYIACKANTTFPVFGETFSFIS